MGKPFISVVITAYNRREYLKYAVKSVINQTLDRRLYEVIVVKNFRDAELDHLIESNGGRIIEAGDEPIGKYLSKGISESEGEVIAFLDDDDAFVSRKLEYVYRLFGLNTDLVYFHHNAYVINKDGRVLGRNYGGPLIRIEITSSNYNNFFKNGLLGDLLSNTVVKRNIFNKTTIDALNRLFISQDTYMFLASLRFLTYSKGLLIHEPINLSFYRIHGRQVSLPRGGSIDETLALFSRSALMNLYGYFFLKRVFPEFMNLLPIRYNPLGGYHYNVLGLIYSGHSRVDVARVSLYALVRGLHDGSPWRVLSSILGLMYILNKRVSRILLINVIKLRYNKK